MSTSLIRDYFTPKGQRKALVSYGSFAAGTAGAGAVKMQLYGLSRTAFGSDAGEDERYAAFEKIYQELNSYWTVYRPHGAELCWPPRRIYDTMIKEFSEFSQSTGITLRGFVRKYHSVMF